ncbi:replication initiation protein [Halonatronum saccharophilum]|uniref:replication initiation protein n=1 Tax=Halonatronum saccharophilum TaxID=150060 RepID=UPI000487B1E6|nr:replication initiation protein [Halonatronum saccharophilum]
MKDKLNKPNELISILPKEKISLIQQKSFNVFLKIAQKQAKFSTEEKYRNIDKEKRYLFRIPCRELKERAGLDKQDYQYIKEELEKLLEIVIEVVDKENKNNWALFHLLESIEKEDDEFEFALDWRIIEALKNCDFFTELDLMQIAELNSKYAVVFYELAIRYEKFKIPRMTIEELRKRTNTQKKYQRTNDFIKFVIAKACEEISEKTDIILTYNTEKKGRRIAYIDFEVERKAIKEELPIPLEPIQVDFSDEVEELYKLLPLETQSKANKKFLDKLLKKHQFKYLKGDIEYAKKKNPKNFIAYLKTSCKRCEEIGGCGEGGHYSSIAVEKAELEKIRAKKIKLEEQERKRLEEIRRDKVKREAERRYTILSQEDKEKYSIGYETAKKFAEKFGGQLSKKDYIISSLEEELEKEVGLDLEDY